MLTAIKSWQLARLNDKVKADPIFANDVKKDNTGITTILYFGYALKIADVFINFMSLSYIVGMTFYICSLQ